MVTRVFGLPLTRMTGDSVAMIEMRMQPWIKLQHAAPVHLVESLKSSILLTDEFGFDSRI
jgi:hypothetical protein